jgi:SET domain-containing protein
MALLEKQLQVKTSNIPGAGTGLFTNEVIPKGARIVEYKGKIRTWKEVKHEDSNYYIYYVTRNYIIDASSYKKSMARYVNDAKGITKIKGLNNNAEFIREKFKIFIEAIRDIPAGGEILVSYGKEYWQVIRKNQRLDAKKNGKPAG